MLITMHGMSSPPTPATRDDFMDPVPAEKEHGTDTLQQKRADR